MSVLTREFPIITPSVPDYDMMWRFIRKTLPEGYSKPVYYSRTVSKLGDGIGSINLPRGITCRASYDLPCKADCYAGHGRFAFDNSQKSMANNLQVYLTNPAYFEAAVTEGSRHVTESRFHSSGDIPDMAYLDMMARIAGNTPFTRHLCFTKKYELVNEWLSKHGGKFPKNLRMVLSNWGEWSCDNPFRLPTTDLEFPNQDNAHLPEKFSRCSLHCGPCVAAGHSCWDLESGDCMVFKKHR